MINPIIYITFNENFKKSFKKFLCCSNEIIPNEYSRNCKYAINLMASGSRLLYSLHLWMWCTFSFNSTPKLSKLDFKTKSTFIVEIFSEWAKWASIQTFFQICSHIRSVLRSVHIKAQIKCNIAARYGQTWHEPREQLLPWEWSHRAGRRHSDQWGPGAERSRGRQGAR